MSEALFVVSTREDEIIEPLSCIDGVMIFKDLDHERSYVIGPYSSVRPILDELYEASSFGFTVCRRLK